MTRYSSHMDERYFNDPTFRQLVDHMYCLVETQKTSFSEVREAVLFAQLRWEMQNPQPVKFSPQLLQEIEVRK